MKDNYILVTGGTGFIGSHTCVELIKAGYNVMIVDNLVNSSADVVKKIRQITGGDLLFIELDLLDTSALEYVFSNYNIESVFHFAGLKAVGESNEKPLKYYQNNVTGTLNLLDCMDRYNVKKLIFSSSATVYGEGMARKEVTYEQGYGNNEKDPVGATNPYGQTKVMLERIIRDYALSNKNFKAVILRYYNPIGAHPSGILGEDPTGIPNNVLPVIFRNLDRDDKYMTIFGDDWPTPDGTGIRDYVHVVDLARGHIAAYDKLKTSNDSNLFIYNLGTGRGTSVKELISLVEDVTGKKVNYKVGPRRQGDLAICFANVDKAKNELGWVSKYDIESMVKHAWAYYKLHNYEG
jgi:UDP-glucose 4-epimerase